MISCGEAEPQISITKAANECRREILNFIIKLIHLQAARDCVLNVLLPRGDRCWLRYNFYIAIRVTYYCMMVFPRKEKINRKRDSTNGNEPCSKFSHPRCLLLRVRCTLNRPYWWWAKSFIAQLSKLIKLRWWESFILLKVDCLFSAF